MWLHSPGLERQLFLSPLRSGAAAISCVYVSPLRSLLCLVWSSSRSGRRVCKRCELGGAGRLEQVGAAAQHNLGPTGLCRRGPAPLA